MGLLCCKIAHWRRFEKQNNDLCPEMSLCFHVVDAPDIFPSSTRRLSHTKRWNYLGLGAWWRFYSSRKTTLVNLVMIIVLQTKPFLSIPPMGCKQTCIQPYRFIALLILSLIISVTYQCVVALVLSVLKLLHTLSHERHGVSSAREATGAGGVSLTFCELSRKLYCRNCTTYY